MLKWICHRDVIKWTERLFFVPVAVRIYLLVSPKDTGNRRDSSEDLSGTLTLFGRGPVKRSWGQPLKRLIQLSDILRTE